MLLSAADYRRCFVWKSNVTAADCPALSNDTREVRPTWQWRSPPAYHLFIGLPTFVIRDTRVLYLMRLMSVAVCAALLASALLSLSESLPGPIARLGLLVGLTPMTLFLFGTVNTTLSRSWQRSRLGAPALRSLPKPTRLLGAGLSTAGIAAIILAITRTPSLVWLAIILSVCSPSIWAVGQSSDLQLTDGFGPGSSGSGWSLWAASRGLRAPDRSTRSWPIRTGRRT